MTRPTALLLTFTGLIFGPTLWSGQCTPTRVEEQLLARAVINSRMWSPALRFAMSTQRSYNTRWVRLGPILLVSNMSPSAMPAFVSDMQALASDLDLSHVDIPIYEIGEHLPSLLAVRRPLWSEGKPDVLLAYARELAEKAQTSIEGPCTYALPEPALLANRRLAHIQQVEILNQITPRLHGVLASSFAKSGSCRGNFVPPHTLETRAVGFLTCTAEGVSEDFYYWAWLSPQWQVLSVHAGFDPPGHKTGQYAYEAVKNRPKLPLSLKFP